MREIKIRIYDPLRNEIVYSSETLSNGWLIDNTKPEYIMQYTGLKDKHGLEIFTGHLIKYKGNSRVREVYFDFEHLQYIARCFGNVSQVWSFYPLVSFTEPYIIGNIYQNPDLLSE